MCFFGGSIRLFINFFLWQRENVQLFLCLKEKVAKRSKQACCLTCFAAHQLCRSVFSVPKIAVPQNSTSAVCKAGRLGFFSSRTNGFDLMGGFFWEPHHANHDPPSRMGSDVSRFVGRAACMDADGCLHKSVNIPTVLFSPQWVFAQNPVEQQTTELPYKFRGNKIGSWGRSSPVGAPKEKIPHD